MGRYVVRRLGQLVVVVLGATMILFACLFVLPGDPVGQIAGSDKARDPAVIEQLHKQYGLDKPLVVQYGTYVGKLAKGDLGQDYTQDRPVTEILAPKLLNTAKLAVVAIVFDVIIGMVAGVIAAMRRYSIWDITVTFSTTLAIGVPSIVLGMIMQWAFVTQLGWFPLISDGTFKSLVLPAFTLAIIDAALVAQIARSTMLEVMGADYVKTAVAKGLSRPVVLLRHILRNSVIPVITYVGISFGALLGGAIITETIFNWDGIGYALVTAIQQNNNPIIVGVVTISVAVFVVLNLIVDLLYAALDPRIRLA
ncbi:MULTISPECIES: ABC transporter permease [unclassified Streptomyces]|uniref:ABC transporter permease n=1 Tax=unclassified Streptomyces TaxID=2593676 RepID=UPI002E2999D0|nr:ABC transporter permease [Streptomyces sp. NBC_01423]WSX93089.1 ABC transporter permease [Streptomyces sp. NBC_00891]WSY07566.1 ABC transporter permease [Streptomyces sp. NBC_00890]WSZ09192.1 ABC transporter permease [Streptomyces sp. NBC_00869]WSZ23309.1 ABC transporter permease [Streptomyces sp. NBC_00870]